MRGVGGAALSQEGMALADDLAGGGINRQHVGEFDGERLQDGEEAGALFVGSNGLGARAGGFRPQIKEQCACGGRAGGVR